MDERPRDRGDTPWPSRAERDARDPARRRGARHRNAEPPAIEDPTRPVTPPLRPTRPSRDALQEPTSRIAATRRRTAPPDDLRTRPVPRTTPVDSAPTVRHPRVAATSRPDSPTSAIPRRPRAPEPVTPEAVVVGDAEEVPPPSGRRRAATAAPVRRTGRRRPRTLGRALMATAAAAVAPGSGHLMLHRGRTGGLILGTFLAGVATLLVVLLTLRRSDLLATALSSQFLAVAAAGCVLVAAAWVGVIVRTWVIAQPRGLDPGRRAAGIAAVTALSLVVAAPLGYAANLANSQRILLGDLFTDEDATVALGQARLNLLLVGSDAGPDRTGTRTDTMIVASIETATGRTTLFSLPRNIGRAQFPPDSPMGEEFPDGFHDADDPTSGNYLLNAVYAYGNRFPELAPATPTDDPGLNLLHQTVTHMLGLQLDYFVELDMAGFASIVDALGGVEVDVGPERIPIGGISPSGRAVPPTGYIEPGIQQLGGGDALAFARSRTGSTDYVRMGRQRCLLQNILSQNAPTDLLTNFQAIAKATTDSVFTDIPQQVLPALVSIADGPLELESVAFDPNLPDPKQSDGRFDTGNPDFAYMREVVQEALARDSAVAPPVVAAAPSDIPETNENPEDAEDADTSAPATSGAAETSEAPLTTTPVSVAQSC